MVKPDVSEERTEGLPVCDGGVKSADLEFLGYRITQVNFSAPPAIDISGGEDGTPVNVSLGFADVAYNPASHVYMVPVSARMEIGDDASEEQEKPDKLEISGQIMGLFKFAEPTELADDFKKELILHQTPAILMPFLRGALGGVIAICGYGAIPLPLINMVHITKEMNRKIVEVSETQE